ncbi:MAG TPA: biopolymer transporter TolR, partial [Opitutaceae bacterium]
MPAQALAFFSPQLPYLPAFFCLLALGVVGTARAGGAVGAFEGHGDIGKVALAGSAQYFADSQEYQIQSSGDDMWTDHDDFHFAWKKVKGDFILQALTQFSSEAGHAKKKMGLMVRASLDSGSAHVNACRHANGEICLQYRRTTGATTEEFLLPPGADVLQLERAGNRYTMSAARFGETFTTQVLDGVVLPDEVYVGIYLCSHDDAVLEKAVFKNVRVIRPAAPDFKPYRDYIGSDIELLDVSSGVRRSIYRAEDSLQAPNWTPDGRSLIYNHNGRMFSLDLASRRPAPINTGAQVHCNNDHTLSFDGKMLGISSGSPSIVYTVPIGGGEPTRITPTGPSYLHSWSPDGKFLLFTGERNKEFDIYRVPSSGGPEERLTTAKGLDDGSEYSPDGKTIYFNSERSGRMQIWKMNADGSG